MSKMMRWTWFILTIALSSPALSLTLDLILAPHVPRLQGHPLFPRPLGWDDYGQAAFGPLALAAWISFFVFGYKWAMARQRAKRWGLAFIVSGGAGCLVLGPLAFFSFFASGAAWVFVLWGLAKTGDGPPKPRNSP